MTTFEIQPSAVQTIVGRAVSVVREYPEDVTAMSSAVDDLAGALAHSAGVARRARGLTDRVFARYSNRVNGHSASAITGATEALEAYRDGDRAMSDQAAAAEASSPFDAARFTG